MKLYESPKTVVCAATGSILYLTDAVEVGGRFYRPECAPGRAEAVVTEQVDPVAPIDEVDPADPADDPAARRGRKGR